MPTKPAFLSSLLSSTSFTSLASAAVLGLGVLTLTACQSDDTGAAPSSTASSPAAPSADTGGTPAATSSPAPASTAPAAPRSAAPRSAAPHSGDGKSGTSKGAGDPAGDEYAFTHPCTPQQLSVHVTVRAGAPSQRVIAVRNTGKRSCGLSYFPLVHLDNAEDPNGEHAVHPMIPSGLGGAPAYPVRPAATAYAVIDLNPAAATTGTVPGIDELNVLPDGDHMPNAATLNFPLPASTPVLHPKLGLYRSTIADAVTSMQSADYQS